MCKTSKRPVTCLITLLTTLLLHGFSLSGVQAQSGEDIAKGLLRALIDSRLEREGRHRDPRADLRPQQPRQLTPEMRQLRTLSASFAQEVDQLAALLQTEARRDHTLRHHLPDVIQFQASAAALRQQADRYKDHQPLMDSYRQLNADWLTLSHRLRGSQRLSPQAIRRLDRVGQLDAQYCALLGIEAQFDSRALVRAAHTLAAELRQLGTLLRYGVPHSAARAGLLNRIERLRFQADEFARLATEDRRLPVVIAEYELLHQEWMRVEVELDRFDNRELTRGVQRVATIHQEIHAYLRLEHGPDRRLVQHLIRDMDSTLVELFRNITLNELISLPGSRDITDAADTTYGTLQNLADVVQRDEPIQSVGEAWTYVSESWELLAFHLAPIRNPQARRRMEEVAGQLSALRQTIGVEVAWDHHEMVRRATAVEAVAGRIHRIVQRWHNASGIRNDHHTQQSRQLSECATELRRRIALRQPHDQIREECDEVIVLWQELRPHLAECDTHEKELLLRLSAGLTPDLIYVRSMLTN